MAAFQFQQPSSQDQPDIGNLLDDFIKETEDAAEGMKDLSEAFRPLLDALAAVSSGTPPIAPQTQQTANPVPASSPSPAPLNPIPIVPSGPYSVVPSGPFSAAPPIPLPPPIPSPVPSPVPPNKKNPSKKKKKTSAKPSSTPIGDSLGSLLAPLTIATTPVIGAFKEVKGVLDSIVSQSKQFVEAFAPSTVQQLDGAMKDLKATIGVALMPVIQTATVVFRAIGSTLYPLMQRLQPLVARLGDVFEKVASSVLAIFGTALIPVDILADAFVSLIEAFEPLIELVLELYNLFTALMLPAVSILALAMKLMAELLKPLFGLLSAATPILRAFVSIITGLVEGFNAFISGLFSFDTGINDVIGNIKAAMGQFAKVIIVATAALAKLAGFEAVIRGMIKGLSGGDKQDNTGAAAAAKDAQFKSFTDFGKDVLKNAFVATGKGKAKTETEKWQTETLKLLNDLKTDDVKEVLKKAIADAADTIVDAIVTKSRRLANEKVDEVKNKIKNYLPSFLPTF